MLYVHICTCTCIHIYMCMYEVVFPPHTHPCSPQVILGVTNPFFVKTLDHWSHIVRLVDGGGAGAGGTEDGHAHSSRSRSPSEGVGDSRPGLFTKYKSFLNRDKTFAKFVSSTKVRGQRKCDHGRVGCVCV